MLVVARAGSGKTATIVNRAWFLVEHAGVDPSEVLVLAFNKVAAAEVQRRLRDRMGEQAPLAATFHSLAARVRSGGAKVTPSEPFLRRLIEASLSPDAERKDGGSFRKLLWAAMKLCWSQELTAIVDGGHHLSDPEMMAFRRAHPVRTLRGNYAPSAAHKAVADALFSHDLKYRYKKRWPPPHFEVAHPERHIVVWISGLDGHVPPPVPDAEAVWTDERTRAHWANKKATTALEFDARNTGRVDVEAWLRDRLAEQHVYVSLLDEHVLWDRCRKRVVGDFTKSAHAFVQHARKRELTPDQLDDLLEKHPASDRSTALLHELVGPLYARYLKQLEAERKTDFDGLLMDACRALRDGATVAHYPSRALDLRRLRYLFVDEYQDFSRLFERFVSSIAAVASELSLCCVGDDWQAINGFAGSDLQFFRDFSKNHPGAITRHLTTNYRSGRAIVELGNTIMAEVDPHGPRGRARSGAVGHICVVDPKELGATFGDNATPRILAVAGALDPEGPLASFSPSRPEQSVMLLARLKMDHALFAADDEEELGEPDSPEEDEERVLLDPSLLPWRERLSVRTIHGAKGLEADIVVLGDVREDRYPFEHPAADLLEPFGITRHVVREEERRLLYVAVTRARHALILLGTEGMSPDLLAPLRTVRSAQIPGKSLRTRRVGGPPVWTAVGVPTRARAASASECSEASAPVQISEIDRVIAAIDGGLLHGANVTGSRLLEYGRAEGLWDNMNRGRAIPQRPSELDQYLHSYGPMVRLQWQHLLSGALGEPIPTGRLRITDYGCGQGLATVLVLDHVRSTQRTGALSATVVSVTLVDPSRSALERARRAVELYEVPVITICAALDGLKADERAEGGATEVHLLSNILDIDKFHLGVLVSKMFAQRGRHHVLAVSPDRDFEGGTPRLERFIQIVQSRFRDRAVVNKLAWQLDNPDRMKAFGFIIRAED